MASEDLQAPCIENERETSRDQRSLWQKQFAAMRPMVVMVTTPLQTSTTAQVVLLRSDVTLGDDPGSDSDRLRFQLACNGRDAQQYGELADVMNVHEQPVYKSANLAMCMVNVAHALMGAMRAPWPAGSVNALKAWFRGQPEVVDT